MSLCFIIINITKSYIINHNTLIEKFTFIKCGAIPISLHNLLFFVLK